MNTICDNYSGLRVANDIWEAVDRKKLPPHSRRPLPAAIGGQLAEIIGKKLVCADDPAKAQAVISKFQRPNDTGRMRL